MILYIHGFGSSGEGAKARLFREYFTKKGVKFLAPSLSFIPELALGTLEEILSVCSEEDVLLVGSSLGGYYATYLSEKYNLGAVLINPSTQPYVTLQKVLGENKSYYDENFVYKWSQKQVDALKSFDTVHVKPKNYFLLVQKGDETLNYALAVEKYRGAKMIVEEGGNHSFLDIERHFGAIEEFMDGCH